MKVSSSNTFGRRRFLRQSVGFSALAALGTLPSLSKRAKQDQETAHLLMIGDWGAEDPQAQSVVARGMRQYVKDHALVPEALLLLGDNWYGELPGGARSSRWEMQFERMYPPGVFPCPAYAVLGNHDYQRWPESKVAAELEYARVGSTGRGATRWTMPSLWYRFDFPAKNPFMTFLALDSNMPSRDGLFGYGHDFTLTRDQQAEQLAWLKQELTRPKSASFLAVMAHHPVYSDGPHGDHPVLVRDWDPLFREHKVDLYLAGHDHDLQHLEFAGHPTTFFLSGGGGADLYDLKTDPSERGPFAKKIYGFSHLSVTKQDMTLQHLDDQGRPLHAFTKTRDGQIAILA